MQSNGRRYVVYDQFYTAMAANDDSNELSFHAWPSHIWTLENAANNVCNFARAAQPLLA